MIPTKCDKIGSSRCLPLLRLVGVIALVLVFRQTFENRSILQRTNWLPQDRVLLFQL